MSTVPRSLSVLTVGLVLDLAACGGQDPQARDGDGWRHVATTAAFDETPLLYIDNAEKLGALWEAAAARNPVLPDVIAVDRSYASAPPFDILIDEPGQAGQPAPLTVDP